MSRFARGDRRPSTTTRPAAATGAIRHRPSWPVLTAEVRPSIDTASWTFTVEGLVERPTTRTWDRIHAVPQADYNGAIHCVTTWSKFDMHWSGVAVDTVLAVPQPLPSAGYVVAYSHTAYTTNLPPDDVTGDKAWIVFEVDGQPLARDHGGPARLLVPHLCSWTSAIWIAGLRVLDHDEAGFWEVRGYHDRDDSNSATKATDHVVARLAHRPPIGPWQDAMVANIRTETPP